MGKLKKIRPLVKELDTRLEKNPADIDALLMRGFLYLEPFHEWTVALDMFKRIIELDPTNVDGYYWLAEIYGCWFRDLRNAELCLRQALHYDPLSAKSHFLMMFMLNTLKESPEEATEHLKVTIRLEPTWLFPRFCRTYELLDKGYLEEAAHEARVAHEIFKNLSFPYPITPLDQYFEKYITRRTSCTQEDFDDLFNKIEEKRLLLTKK